MQREKAYMGEMLGDYTFHEQMRYEGHRMVVACCDDAEPLAGEEALSVEEPLCFGGFFGAALLAVMLIQTEEGDARGIKCQTAEERELFYTRYEREVLRDDWGYLASEVSQLHDAHVQLAVSETALRQICPNIRLLDLFWHLVTGYMDRLTEEEFGRHIWECVEWEAPFSQWLLDAGRMESRRQQYLQTDWHDAVSVSMLEGSKDEGVTFFFEGEDANDILLRYFQWLCGMYESQMKSIPGAKITNADRNYILSQETDIGYLSDELDGLDPEVQASFKRWMEAWEAYLTARLKPEEEIHFWNKEVPEELREKLLDYLRLQEKQPAHYQALTSAVYALRQLGYVRYKLSVRSMRKWLSDHLSENYMLKNTSTQFDRAWKAHGRYTPEVQEQVDLLAEYGIKHL